MTQPASRPRFTIVVPTRERRDTLEATLATCLDQRYPALEIVVCDNFSGDGTADFVKGIRDPRLRYVNPGRRLSMASNWEFALQHVRPGYVMVLGDDDGMMPHGVEDIADTLQRHSCEAIAWNQAIYTWPECGRGKTADRLKLSLSREVELRDARDALARVVDCEASYKILPSLYWGAIHTDVIERARATSGRYVNAVNPDVYSAVSTCMVVDRYVICRGAFSLMGLSRHSTGVSFRAGQSGEGTEVGKFFEEVDLEEHEDVPMVPAADAYTVEAYMQARDHVPGGERFPRPDFRTLLEAVVRQASTDNEGVYPMLTEACQRLAARHGLEAELEALLDRYPRRPHERHESPVGLNLVRGSLKIDCAELRVFDVQEASELAYYATHLYDAGYFSPAGVVRSTLERAKARVAAASRGAAVPRLRGRNERKRN